MLAMIGCVASEDCTSYMGENPLSDEFEELGESSIEGGEGK